MTKVEKEENMNINFIFFPLQMAQATGDGPYPAVLAVKLPTTLGLRGVVQG